MARSPRSCTGVIVVYGNRGLRHVSLHTRRQLRAFEVMDGVRVAPFTQLRRVCLSAARRKREGSCAWIVYKLVITVWNSVGCRVMASTSLYVVLKFIYIYIYIYKKQNKTKKNNRWFLSFHTFYWTRPHANTTPQGSSSLLPCIDVLFRHVLSCSWHVCCGETGVLWLEREPCFSKWAVKICCQSKRDS